jgi:hypothetical protein
MQAQHDPHSWTLSIFAKKKRGQGSFCIFLYFDLFLSRVGEKCSYYDITFLVFGLNPYMNGCGINI